MNERLAAVSTVADMGVDDAVISPANAATAPTAYTAMDAKMVLIAFLGIDNIVLRTNKAKSSVKTRTRVFCFRGWLGESVLLKM